jgi:hypothetical protein
MMPTLTVPLLVAAPAPLLGTTTMAIDSIATTKPDAAIRMRLIDANPPMSSSIATPREVPVKA